MESINKAAKELKIKLLYSLQTMPTSQEENPQESPAEKKLIKVI